MEAFYTTLEQYKYLLYSFTSVICFHPSVQTGQKQVFSPHISKLSFFINQCKTNYIMLKATFLNKEPS